MCSIPKHEAIKNDPELLAATTKNPRHQYDADGSVLFVMRDCASCASTLCVTEEQEAAAQRGVSDTG